MTHKLKFKRYRGLVQYFGLPLSYPRKITQRQSVLLQKLSLLAHKKKKTSYFGQKLQSKRIFSLLYGNLPRKQFRLFLRKAAKLQGSLSSNFISLLERRLDMVVFRMFQFRTLESARQYIQHKGILLNNATTSVCSCQVSPGDIIKIKNKNLFLSQNRGLFKKGVPERYQTKALLQDNRGNCFQSGTDKNQGDSRPKDQHVGPGRPQILFSKEYRSKALEKKQKNLNNETLVGSQRHLKGGTFSKVRTRFPSLSALSAQRTSKVRYPHFEVNYKLFSGIFLFSPRQLFYPLKFKKEDFCAT